jgi:hypothetical protein
MTIVSINNLRQVLIVFMHECQSPNFRCFVCRPISRAKGFVGDFRNGGMTSDAIDGRLRGAGRHFSKLQTPGTCRDELWIPAISFGRL